MKIKLDIDLTPEEMRRLVGLPDVKDFNDKVMTSMLEKLQSGEEGFDPLSIFQGSIAKNTDFTKQWMGLFGGLPGKTDK